MLIGSFTEGEPFGCVGCLPAAANGTATGVADGEGETLTMETGRDRLGATAGRSGAKDGDGRVLLFVEDDVNVLVAGCWRPATLVLSHDGPDDVGGAGGPFFSVSLAAVLGCERALLLMLANVNRKEEN